MSFLERIQKAIERGREDSLQRGDSPEDWLREVEDAYDELQQELEAAKENVE